MKLATIDSPDGHALAAVTGAGLVDLRRALPAGPELTGLDALCQAMAAGDAALGALADAVATATPRWEASEVTLLAPVQRPGKIVCIGLNYYDHCRETGTPVPEAPVVFAKFPSAIVGPGQFVDAHEGSTSELDWEVELVAVMGTRAGPGRARGLGDVLGYTVGNDVSARDLQRREGQWVRAKSLDTWCPLGPVVVTADEIPDPQALGLGLEVNGQPQQQSSTAEMIFSVEQLLARLTRSITLEPGDLLFTGTPRGTGGFQQPARFLAPGDTMEAWVEGIGRLTNVVRSGPTSAPAGSGATDEKGG